jgi:hypothetical protein
VVPGAAQKRQEIIFDIGNYYLHTQSLFTLAAQKRQGLSQGLHGRRERICRQATISQKASL